MREKKLHPSEEELVSSLKKKSETSFNFLFNNYSSSLLGVIIRIVQNKDLAEDILQDLMVKIWGNIDDYDPSKGRLFTWMLNVAKNLAIDKLRSKDYRNANRTFDIQDNVGAIDFMKSNAVNIDSIGLKLLIEKLEPQLFSVLNMVYFKGYTHVETAEEMQIPLGTVKTRIRYGILELRKVFAYNALKAANLLGPDQPLQSIATDRIPSAIPMFQQEQPVLSGPEWKKILDAVYYNDFSPQEVANILNIELREARKIAKMSLSSLKQHYRNR